MPEKRNVVTINGYLYVDPKNTSNVKTIQFDQNIQSEDIFCKELYSELFRKIMLVIRHREAAKRTNVFFFNDDNTDPMVGTMQDYLSIREISDAIYTLSEETERTRKQKLKDTRNQRIDDIYDRYQSIFDQANEIYYEQYADSSMAGGSDIQGDAQFTKMEFLSSRIPRKYWKMFGIYNPHEEIRSRINMRRNRMGDDYYDQYGDDMY